MKNNRRSFLKKTAIAGIGLGTYPSLVKATRVASTGTEASTMHLAAGGGPAEFPYTVLPVNRALSYPLTTAGNESLGVASLSYTEKHLIIEASVRDVTPIFPADSVGFTIGRHPFVVQESPEGGRVWDNLYQCAVEGADTVFERTLEGYRLRAAIPWGALALLPKDGLCFQFALEINDRIEESGSWRESGRRLHFPQGVVEDRVSTYGTVVLSSTPIAGTAPAPERFVSLDIRTYAYASQAEALVQRTPSFADSSLWLVCRAPDGTVLSEQPVPAGVGRMLMSLAWDEKQAGICVAELWLEADGRRLGPVAEPYFCAGESTIANYHSPRKAPRDLASFWERKIADMRARPMNAMVSEIESDRPDVIVDKVSLDNHRGNPMIVWVSRIRADGGPRPAKLNVYPPMGRNKPVWPQGGHLGITFCGSLVGECRLPGQTQDEGLWARAEILDDCYWLDVVLDGIRVMDYVAGRPDSDGRVLVDGGSRGGWYTLALAALAPDRVALARFAVPCYSDVTMNRYLGYSSAATEIYSTFERDRVKTGGKVFDNFRYFDPLFLAELIRTRVIFSAGLQDHICSAIGMIAAAHRIPKEFCTFVLDAEGGHGDLPWIDGILQLAE
jgi:cephalosporin-C deacetylase